MLAYLKATIDEKKQNTKKTDAYLASTAVHAIEDVLGKHRNPVT